VAEIPATRPVRVEIAGLAQGADEPVVRQSVERALTRAQIGLGGAKESVALRLSLQPPPAGGGRAVWQVSASDAGGRALFSSDYTSVLPASADARTLSAFAEAAVLSVLPRLRQNLAPKVTAK
jgi:hypothetical protein